MLQKIVLTICAVAVSFGITALAQADGHMPGKGVKVKPARATWNTGFFQEALARKALGDLGYEVEKPVDLQNPIFYKTLALGDVDYWVNGWFPMHNAQMPDDFYDSAQTIGYVIKAGGLQGYLVSKKHVEQFDIKTIADFSRDEVKKAFDKNKDGKADLTACPPGWGCEKVIAHHMQVYELEDHINPVKAAYEAGMASALAEFKNGEPIFFYTWAPNWTLGKLKPGTDVMWVPVPETLPTEAQMEAKEQMTAEGIEGAIADPIELGFVVADIRAVANKSFLESNPPIKRFFEVFALPLGDINEQNTRMDDGEKSQKDIERHVDEWIAKNQSTYDGWLEEARKAAK